MGPIRFLIKSITGYVKEGSQPVKQPLDSGVSSQKQTRLDQAAASHPGVSGRQARSAGVGARLSRLQSLLSFAPLFVVNALQQANYHLGFGVAAGMALLSILLERLVVLLGRAKIWPKQLACWLTLIYAILFGLTWAADGVFVNRWYILIANGALTLAALAGMLVKKPFTADFAKERAPEQMWGHPKFLQINMIITAAWVLAFAIVTASNAVVAAECTVDQVNSSCPAPKAINIIFSYILPFGSLIAAALFTQWFSERARARARAAMAAAGDAGLSTYNEYQVAEGPVAPKAEPV